MSSQLSSQDRLSNSIKTKFVKPKSKAGHSQTQPFESNIIKRISIQKKLGFKCQQTDRIMLDPALKKQQRIIEKVNIRTKQVCLKQIISQQKKKVIIKNFTKILKINNTNSKPIQYHPFQTVIDVSFIDKKGFQLNELIFIIIAIFSLIEIILLLIFYSLAIVFQQIEHSQILIICQSVGFILYSVEMIINFVTVKLQQGKRLITFREIWIYYLKTNFIIDFISIAILIIDLTGRSSITIYLRLFIILKLTQGLQKIQKLQIMFITNFYYQQYWSLIKVFLFNFSFAHFLAICLILMATIDDSTNWMIKKGIDDNQWYERYAWSYYWATTIMLTVGFGDIAATNYKQAIVLTFIQTISCIALAYNINCVGTLISNIRLQDLEKGKNFKTFRKLSQKNHVSANLQWRINNYIQQSSNIKKKFNYQEQNVFVQKLPNGLKKQFLKQSNKKIFHNLPFFKNLMQKTLFTFAQKIQMHICHPGQIIQHLEDPHNLMILKGGQIGFICNKSGCDFNQTVITKLKRNSIDEPFLISLGFIRQNRQIFQIQSLEYSILYFLDHQKIKGILKECQNDYENYRFLKDKSSFIPDEYELLNCQECKSRHTKFTCPKLHFIPIQMHVITKQIYKMKNSKCSRIKDKIRLLRARSSACKKYNKINANQFMTNNTLSRSRKTYNLNMHGRKRAFIQIEKQANVSKQITDVQSIFYNNTVNIIKNQMSKVLNSQCIDQVWLIQSDQIRNYKYYFQMDNSCNIVGKYDLNKEQQSLDESQIINSSRVVSRDLFNLLTSQANLNDF